MTLSFLLALCPIKGPLLLKGHEFYALWIGDGPTVLAAVKSGHKLDDIERHILSACEHATMYHGVEASRQATHTHSHTHSHSH